MPPLPVALHLALRELRGGIRGFRIFLACLALGVAAIAAVGSVRAAIEAGLDREAAAILGGDARIEFAYRFADAEERAWMEARAAAISEVVEFRSMAIVGADAANRTLAEVKGVDDSYPLYGSLGLEGAPSIEAALAPRDGMPGLAAAPELVDRLGLALGDEIRLGARSFRLGAILTREPDAASAGFALGPRILVRTEDLAGSGLLAEGTLYSTAYRLRLAPEADLDALRATAGERFAEIGLQWRDRRNAAPGLDRFVGRLGSFLVLMGLAGLAVGGVGVSAAVRAHLDRRIDTIATLKTLGATGNTIFAIYLGQIGLLALLGVAIGLGLGAALPLIAGPLLAERLPLPAAFGLYPRPLAEAALYGLLTALLFSLWPLARARDIRAGALFRDTTRSGRGLPRPRFLLLIAALALALLAAATLLSESAELALWSATAVLGALALLALAARGVSKAARSLSRGRLARGRPALRLALGAVGGPGGETAAAILSLGLGLAVLAAIGQIDANFRALVSDELPDRAPAFFAIDIQDDQLAGFVERASGGPGVEEVETAPMLRGVITRINGRPAREVVGRHWALGGDRGVSYAAAPPPGTDLVAGEWWPADYDGPPLMSFGAEEAAEMGIGLGDTMTINVLGRDVTATIASLREVEFESLGINFLMIVDPAALAGAPNTHIATIYAPPGSEAALLRDLGLGFPNVTMVGVRDVIGRIAEAMAGISAATRWGAAVTLATGLIVLIGAAAAGERARVFEAAVLKTLGASRARILASFALRAAILGAAAGVVAILAGGLAGWAVTVFVMEADFAFAPLSALAIVAGGAAASLLAGLAFALPPLRARPARVLRARD